MKIIEGTLEEIIKYQREQYINISVEPRQNKLGILEGNAHQSPLGVLDYSHWSGTKRKFIKTSEMDKAYLLNIIKKKIRESSKINGNETLFEDAEFAAVVYALAYRLYDGKIKYNPFA